MIKFNFYIVQFFSLLPFFLIICSIFLWEIKFSLWITEWICEYCL